MTETDLHFAERLRTLLPPLTPEERQQLKENIESDGRVRDPILYWHDGNRNVVIDGMHRWDIVRGTEIPFCTEQLKFANYEEAEVWILKHQVGRRNLLNPAAVRKVRGQLYNRLKTGRGGDHTSQEAKCRNDTLLSDAAQKVAEKAGVSPATVKRDGARVEALEKLSKAARIVAEKAGDKDILALGKLSLDEQDAVARAVGVRQAATIRDAIKQTGAKPSKGTDAQETDYGRCPNCAGTKWTEDEGGVSCARCHHPHGEPAGDVDEDRITTQRQKTVKTVEALMRTFDDLQLLLAKPGHSEVISDCKRLLTMAKAWK